MTKQFSEYQQAVIEWVKNHTDLPGSLIVQAVAGSGKTTTVVEAAKHIPTSHKSVFLAFNKSIATELGNKLPDHVFAKTLNALGYGAVRSRFGNIKVDGSKTFNIVRNNLAVKEGHEPMESASAITKLVGLAKSFGYVPSGIPGADGIACTTEERWMELADRFQIDIDINHRVLFGWCDEVLRIGLMDQCVVDFDDQLYMVVAWNIPVSQFDWIIIDEAQDVSHVQRAMLRKFLKPSGRLIAVGDASQAIYGFRGADSKSLQNIRDEFNAEELPLSICYRCPKKVVELAQGLVPQIQAADAAPEGKVAYPEKWALDAFTRRDLIVCRNTAPLLKFAYKRIANGLAVEVMGRDIGKNLTNLIKKVAGKRCKHVDEFVPKLDAWQLREMEKAKARNAESMMDAIDDKYQSIMAAIDNLTPEQLTVGDLVRSIESLFDSKSPDRVVLATIHKAKGLEAERVFVLEPDLMPSKYARQEWSLEQERNLMYVAYTRALSELYFLPLEVLR